MEHKNPTVSAVTSWIINDLNEKRETSFGKAALATLRNSAGRPVSDSAQVWPIIFEKMPESFLGTGREMTAEEKSMLLALQLFALHQQGKSETVLLRSEQGTWKNVGFSLSTLRTNENQVAVDRHFRALITSSTFEELTHHLRQMIKLLKSRTTDAKVDYPKLAQDLYWVLRGNQGSVMLNWARGYYGTKQQGENKNEKQ